MRPLAFAVSVAIGSAGLLAASGARAQTPVIYNNTPYSQTPPPPAGTRAAEPAKSAYETKGLLGFELMARGGVFYPDAQSPVLAPDLYPGTSPGGSDPTGDILRGTEKPYSVDLTGLSFLAGYRFLPELSVGAWFSYTSFQVMDGTDSGDYKDGTSQAQRSAWQLGAYGRYYVLKLHPRLQPWVELGIGYSNDTSSFVRGGNVQGSVGQSVVQDYYVTHRGLAVPLTVGLDWRLAPVFSVGPAIGYERVFGLSGCVDSEPQTDATHPTTLQAVNTCSSPPVQTNGYGVFFGGIFLKVTFGRSLPAQETASGSPFAEPSTLY